MHNVLAFFLYLWFGILSFDGHATAQDSLLATQKEIKYDEAKDLQIPELSEETIEEFKNDRTFDYSELSEEANWWTTFKSWLWELWLKFWHWLVGDYQANGFVAFLVHTLPYIIIGGIVIFIGWIFYKLNPGVTFFGSRERPNLFFSEEEEIIRSKNISELMERALADKDYRLAIRYYYLLILQKLSDANIISYESDKTNSEYISEISSETIKSGFQKATNLYDHVWYGNFEVTEADFSKAQPTFISLRNQIPKTVA